jgi:hypothetical protein
MNWKGLAEVLSRKFPGGLRKTTKIISHSTRFPSRDKNPGRAEYEAGVLCKPAQPGHIYCAHNGRKVSPSFVDCYKCRGGGGKTAKR